MGRVKINIFPVSYCTQKARLCVSGLVQSVEVQGAFHYMGFVGADPFLFLTFFRLFGVCCRLFWIFEFGYNLMPSIFILTC